MKKVLLFLSVLLSLGLFCACSKSDETTDDNGEVKDWGTRPADWTSWTSQDSIRDLTGFVTYNNELQAWYFISSWPIMDEGPHYYYPIELGDDFKVDGLWVTISGRTYLNKEEYRMYIDITKIERCKSSTKEILDRRDYISMQNDDCYSGYVTDAEEDDIFIRALLKDEDLIKVLVTEVPPHDHLFWADRNPDHRIVYFLTSDFQDSDIRVGDIIDFRIDLYKQLEIKYIYDYDICHKYLCSVKPCK